MSVTKRANGTIMQKGKVYAFGLVSLLLTTGWAHAQYFDQPIEITVSYGSGGSSDIAARTFTEYAENYIDGNFVVQNRPGAGGLVGTEHVYNATPDGTSLLLGRVATLAVGPAVQDVPYDVEELTYIGLLSTDPFVCVTGADQPYEDLDGLAEAIRSSPGAVTYNSSGVGSLNQFAALRLLEALDIENPETAATHVPDTGEGPALSAVVGEHIDFFCGNLAPTLPQIEAGQVRPFFVTTEERLEGLPEVPTAEEAGVPEMQDVVGWSALVGPPQMDDEAVAALQDVMEQVGEDEDWRQAVLDLGSVPDIRGPEETRAFVERQLSDFVEMVDRLGLRQ